MVTSALVVHVARYWRPFGFIASVAATGLLVWAIRGSTSNTLDLFGVSFGLQPLARDYLLIALAMSGILAIATSFGEIRRTLGFLFWSWIAWVIALSVNDFVVGVFAWATGLAALVLAMEPRRAQRVGGAAYYLVFIILGSALLLLGNRFVQLYPLTPDQTALIDTAILFFTWGLGLLLAIVPFMVWLGPMADETPLPIIAMLLGLGQPIGLWLLYELIGQYPRLLEQSNLLAILTYGGMGAIFVGGLLCLFERRAGRLMSFAALFALGFVLLDLSRGTMEGTAYAVIEMFARALSLSVMAASISIARTIPRHWMQILAIFIFSLGGLNLAGIAPGIALATRWNILLEMDATDRRLFLLIMLATIGVLVGLARFVLLWIEIVSHPLLTPTADVAGEPVIPNAPRSVRQILQARVLQGVERLTARVPKPLQRSVRAVEQNWTPLFATLLLVGLGAFVLWYNVTPNLWLQRTLETVSKLTFVR